MVLDFASISVR